MNNEPKPTNLGATLAELRERAGLTLYELAKRTDINRSNLHRMENGVITNPSQETLNRLALALDIEPETLYDAVWQDTGDVLPSMTTYFRSKFSMTDDQIAVVERAMRRAGIDTNDTSSPPPREPKRSRADRAPDTEPRQRKR